MSEAKSKSARPSVWFVVPAHRRVALARVCLRQLARTCDELGERGIDASAVMIADDENLETARELGFGTIERPNTPLGAKLNDGFEFAAHEGVDYVIPFGSDDWIDAALLDELPAEGVVRAHRLSAAVSPDGERLAKLRVDYDGGDGVRVYPTSLFAPLHWRPVDDHRDKALDTSARRNLLRVYRELVFDYRDLHGLQIVDFKSGTRQLTPFEPLARDFGTEVSDDPWGELAEHYPAVAIDEMRALYAQRVAA